MYYHKYIFCLSFLVVILFISCQADDLNVTAQGSLKLSIEGISSETTETRSTPAELKEKNGLSAENFHLTITRDGYLDPYYNGEFTTKEMEIPMGTYNIESTYGENPLLGRDTPYYIGTTTAVVEENKTTEASLTCKVGNALVSVIFGEDEAQAARFDKFYSSCRLLVDVGNYSMDISKENSSSSIYLRAGSNFGLSFQGILREENGRTVNTDLKDESLPSKLGAGEHLIITLNPGNTKTTVNIHKVEVKTITLEETIPLSWLPIAAVLPMHQYDSQGNLVGTDLTITNSFPGMEWEAIVTNANRETVRGISGSGTLSSKHENNAAWPYLPEGKYTATYYLITEEGKMKASSREFIIHAPELKFTLEGYTSYSKYLEGDIEAANECDANTFYSPSVSINVSPELMKISKYNTTFTCEFNGTKTDITGKDVMLNDVTGLIPRSEAYTLSASITFGGSTYSGKKDFYITGLPLRFQPPAEAFGWTTNGSNNITFESTHVRLGGKADNSNQAITYNKISIPASTVVELQPDISIHPATKGTELTIKLGDEIIFKAKEEGGAANTNDYPYSQKAVLQLTRTASFIECHNSYGSLDGKIGSLGLWRGTSSYIYKLDFLYGTK